MNDLHNTLIDIARTAVEHDATLLNHIRHPDEDADYYADQEEMERAEELEKQRQEWWQQMDEDQQYIQDHDFAEYQGGER